MKKTFFTLSLRKTVGEIVLLAVSLLIIVAFVCFYDWEKFNFNYEFIFLLIIYLVAFAVYFNEFLRIALCRIKIYEEKMIATGDKDIFNKPLVQYREEVKFQEIVAVRVILSSLNSKKTHIDPFPRPRIDNIFFEIENVNHENIWICINYFSKKQRQKMLDIINEKIGSNYNYNILWEECQKEIKLKKEQKRKKKTK